MTYRFDIYFLTKCNNAALQNHVRFKLKRESSLEYSCLIIVLNFGFEVQSWVIVKININAKMLGAGNLSNGLCSYHATKLFASLKSLWRKRTMNQSMEVLCVANVQKHLNTSQIWPDMPVIAQRKSSRSIHVTSVQRPFGTNADLFNTPKFTRKRS